MKINFHAWVRNKASVVDDMECDLTESSHRIKMKKKKDNGIMWLTKMLMQFRDVLIKLMWQNPGNYRLVFL